MEEPTGIIYIRKNELCVLKQIIKIGITGNELYKNYYVYHHKPSFTHLKLRLFYKLFSFIKLLI